MPIDSVTLVTTRISNRFPIESRAILPPRSRSQSSMTMVAIFPSALDHRSARLSLTRDSDHSQRHRREGSELASEGIRVVTPVTGASRCTAQDGKHGGRLQE